jgi:Ca2+-binding EF-hand superfamily protein
MNGLLTMTCNSTKVARGTEVKLEKVERKQKKDTEIESLKLSLKKALAERGIKDLRGVFKRFDTNGDGYFNEIEFGCAFTVMGVDFNKDNLRKLIRVSDKN